MSIKNLVFKERQVKKLTKRYVGLYKIEEVVSKNVVKLKLSVFMQIYLVVNIYRIEQYKKPIKGQRVKELKLVKLDGVKE